LPLSDGLQSMGLCVVPVGVEGGTRRVLDFTLLTKPHALIATPSFGEYLIEQAPKLIGKNARELGIRWFYCAGEPGAGIPSLRKKLQEGFGAKVFDHTGGGHAFHGISCETEPYPGMHFVSADHCILELVDPETKDPIEISHGAMGEMVFTFIGWEGGPFMRYALGDLIQIYTEACSCGWPEMRFKILGLSLWIAILLTLLISALLGIITERLVIRPAMRAPHFNIFIITLGVSIVMKSLSGFIWSHNDYPYPSVFPDETISFGNATFDLIGLGNI
ncbi:unnamed protein product, partial [marine sediment metagenome]